MTRATPDTCPSPLIIADGDYQTVIEHVSEVVETASTLMAMCNVPFDSSKGRSQKVKGNKVCFDQTTNQTTPFDANESVSIYIKGVPEVLHNMGGEQMKLFSDEELNGLLEIVKVDDDYLEVVCACTSKMHGHYVGHLKVFRDGNLLIDCKCIPGCDLENVTPEEFMIHARAKLGPSKWARCIWVYDRKGGRIVLKNTPLLRYYKIAGMKVEMRGRFRNHRDEFIKCTKCGMDRRFKLKSGEECREYHEAFVMKDRWTCSLHPLDMIVCGSEGERASRKLVRGCTRNGTCRGCSICVCYGCHHCRFSDCGCRLCMDFIVRSSI